jgi:RNA polymerase sigma factor (sigma-70 family)
LFRIVRECRSVAECIDNFALVTENRPKRSARLPETKQFIAELTAGNPGAMSGLHQRFAERIFYLALRHLRSREDAEDIRNETLIRVTQAVRKGRLASPDALPAFVAGTARHVIHEFFRRSGRAEPIMDRDFASEAQLPEVDHTVRRAINKVIQRLKPRERDFIRLYYYEELPNPDVSRRLGIPEERLRLIKSRALKSFREIYGRLVK